MRRETWTGDDAVTPVIGTVLILLITMAGMGAVLAWGVPAVQGIQDQSSQAAMEGEFSDLRLNTMVLKIVDSSRLRSVALADGELGLEPGSRFAIHAVHNTTTNPDCDIRVSGWSTSSDTLTVATSGCGSIVTGGATDATQLDLTVDKLVGSSVQRLSGGLSPSGSSSDKDFQAIGTDFSEGNWRVRLTDGAGDLRAQVFIIGTDRIAWHLETSVSDIDLYVEGGALWLVRSPQVFSLAGMQVSEDVFGSGDYLLELPTYSGPRLEVGSPSDPQVFLQLQGSHGRIAGQDTLRLRYDVSGDLAEAWCNHILFRNATISAGTYTEDPAATCEDGDPATGVRSLTYEPTDGDPFPFEFIHKRVYVSIST